MFVYENNPLPSDVKPYVDELKGDSSLFLPMSKLNSLIFRQDISPAVTPVTDEEFEKLQARYAANKAAIIEYDNSLADLFEFLETLPQPNFCHAKFVRTNEDNVRDELSYSDLNLLQSKQNEDGSVSFDLLYKGEGALLSAVQAEFAKNYQSCMYIDFPYQKDEFGLLHYRYFNENSKYDEQLKEEYKEHYNNKYKGFISSVHLLGIGLGYGLGALLRKIDTANIFITEPNLEVFYASVYAFDWANAINFCKESDTKLHFFLGLDKDLFFTEINKYFEEEVGFQNCLGYLVALHSDDEICKQIAEHIISIDFAYRFSSLGFFDDSMFSLCHGYANCQQPQTRFLSNDAKFSDDVLNRPLFIVGNGPSLSNDIPFLRKMQDKALIVACGSAIEPLYRSGIKPHFFACTERIKDAALPLALIPDPDYLKDIILVATDVVNPQLIKFFKHTALFLKVNESFCWALAERVKFNIKQLLIAGNINPLVSNMAVSFAQRLGFKNVILFGLDYGTKSELLHAKESFLYNEFFDDKKVYNNKELLEKKTIGKGNFGGEIVTTSLFHNSVYYLNDTMKTAKAEHGAIFFNCSDGLLIDEAIPAHTAQFNAVFAALSDIDREKLISDFSNATTQVTLCDVDTFFAKKHTQEVIDIFISGVSVLGDEKHPNHKYYKTRKDVFSLCNSIVNICLDLKKGGFYCDYYLFYGSIFFVIGQILCALYSIDDERKAVKASFHVAKKVYYFLLDAKKWYEAVPNFFTQEHLEQFNNKIGFDHEGSLAPSFEPRHHGDSDKYRAEYPVQKFEKRYE